MISIISRAFRLVADFGSPLPKFKRKAEGGNNVFTIYLIAIALFLCDVGWNDWIRRSSPPSFNVQASHSTSTLHVSPDILSQILSIERLFIQMLPERCLTVRRQ